jgi:hypothetical protein
MLRIWLPPVVLFLVYVTELRCTSYTMIYLCSLVKSGTGDPLEGQCLKIGIRLLTTIPYEYSCSRDINIVTRPQEGLALWIRHLRVSFPNRQLDCAINLLGCFIIIYRYHDTEYR